MSIDLSCEILQEALSYRAKFLLISNDFYYLNFCRSNFFPDIIFREDEFKHSNIIIFTTRLLQNVWYINKLDFLSYLSCCKLFATRDTSLTQNTNNIILSRYTRNRNLLLYNFVTRLLSLLEFLSTRSVYLIVLLHIWFIYILSPDYVVYPPNNCLFDFRFSSFLFSPLFFSIYYTTSLRYIYSDIYIFRCRFN